MAQSVHGYLVVVEYFCPLTVCVNAGLIKIMIFFKKSKKSDVFDLNQIF